MDEASLESAMGALMWTYAVGGVVGIVALIAMWRIFTKAGKPGWAAIVPIYNVIVLLQVVNRPWWWLLLMLIPFVNIVILFIVTFDLGKSFGKGGAFSFFLLILLSLVGYCILGFGKSEYQRIERKA